MSRLISLLIPHSRWALALGILVLGVTGSSAIQNAELEVPKGDEKIASASLAVPSNPQAIELDRSPGFVSDQESHYEITSAAAHSTQTPSTLLAAEQAGESISSTIESEQFEQPELIRLLSGASSQCLATDFSLYGRCGSGIPLLADHRSLDSMLANFSFHSSGPEPSSVVALPFHRSVALHWSRSTEVTARGYRVAWATDQSRLNNLTSTGAAVSGVTTQNVSNADVTQFNHTSLTNGTTYFYRIGTEYRVGNTTTFAWSSVVQATPVFTITERFELTRATEEFVVPAGVNWIRATLRGAAGGDVRDGFGEGGIVTSVIPVTPGETLRINVGSRPTTRAGEIRWGFNGGGVSTFEPTVAARGGGGATDVRRGGNTLADRILVAGGGGGAGSASLRQGGSAFGLIGGNDRTNVAPGGSQSATINWPAAASNLSLRSEGTLGQGANSKSTGGGAGGGGYYGGSAYGTAGGGGGSSWVYQDALVTTFTAGSTGDGSVTFEYVASAIPQNVQAFGLQRENVLTWDRSKMTGVTGYKIYHGTSPNPTTVLATINSPDTLFYRHTSIGNGIQRYYRITAIAGALETAFSAEVSAIPAFTSTVRFDFTGDVQTFEVPQGVTWLQVTAEGAQGGVAQSGGWGFSQTVTSIIPVTPGEILNINVGSMPKVVAGQTIWGFNGGGIPSDSDFRRGGGGATDIRRGGNTWSDRILVAGGGGGAGSIGGSFTGYGGWGGWPTGGVDFYNYSAGGGQTAQITWGTKATDLSARTPGSLGQGASSRAGGGAGGGGYYGGSAYSNAGGGGGSSYLDPNAVRVSFGMSTGDGQLEITFPTKAYPDELRVTPMHRTNYLSWDPVQISGVLGYNIYWGTTPNPTTLLVSLNGANISTYTHGSLTNGTTYYYRVSARVSGTETERSAIVSGTPNTTVTKEFSATGQTEQFVVPAGVYFLRANLSGAGGGVAHSGGWGFGGSVTSIIPVTPGEILNINVGSKPEVVAGQTIWGFNGGGIPSDSDFRRGGGGATDIRRGGNTWSDRILVAGGGGGTGSIGGSFLGYGGWGGWPTGGVDINDYSAGGGQTAQITWGTKATDLSARTPGSLGQGASSRAGGGAGGGGYYGGSAYSNAGGGGGSSWAHDELIGPVFVDGNNGLDGSVRFEYIMNEPVADLVATAGNRTVDLSWAKSETTGVTGYRVFRGTAPNPTTLLVTINNAATTTHKSTNLVNGTTYYFRVEPFGSGFTGARSLDVSATPSPITVVNFTGSTSPQSFVVPPQVSWLRIEAFGAQGGVAQSGGWGFGGITRATIPVTPGETLNLFVGTAPKLVNNQVVWGFNGGGIPSDNLFQRGGGGATDVRRGPGLSDRIVVAGGGGGAGSQGGTYLGYGGWGGWPTGGVNFHNSSAGGGQTAEITWGASATNLSLRTPGSLGQGASLVSRAGGGAGGGGYYGGSAYSNAGGGGGSSWAYQDAKNVSYVDGGNAGDGRLVISYTIDVDAPVVTGITSPSPSGTYRAGTDIFLDVMFSEPVFVDGSPTLDVNAGTRNPVRLSYVAGSGTSALRFKYTVVPGDNSGPQGLEIASTTALSLNGATIADPAGNVAVTTLPTPGSATALRGVKTLVIDGDVPAAPVLVSAGGSTRIDLQWDPNSENDLKEYRIYVSTDQTNFSQLGTTNAPGTSFSQLIVATGITYYYYITAVDINGNESDRSAIVSWFIPTPGAVNIPAIVVPTPTNSQSPTITGVADPGAEVLIYDETSGTMQLLGTAQTAGDGKFSFQIPGPLSEGNYSISARASFSSLVSAKTIVRPLVVDLTAPSIISILRLNPSAERTSEVSLTWRVRFSEEVRNVRPSDFLALSTSASITSARQNSANKLEWDVTLSGGDIGSIRGPVGIRFVASPQLTDLSGNLLSSTTPSGTVQTYIIDRSNPLVVISSSAQSLGGSNPSTSVSFSIDMEASNNFTVDDISVVGGTLSGFSGSGQTFSATLTATAGFEGIGKISIRSGVFTSNSGNPNRASVDLEIPIDMVAPRVISVDRFVPNGAYGVGAEVDVVVNFSEPITLTGTPTLLLETGSTDRTAAFLSATQSQIIFRYTVQAGDNSTDLNYQSTNALDLAGGSIVDAVGNSATTSLPGLNDPQSLKSLADLVIDTIAPSKPGNPTITVVGGRLVTNFINSTNTNITSQASVTAADYTFGGRAELLANGVVVASTSNMTSPVNLSLATTTPAALQALIPEGSVTFEIRVFDAAGNQNTSNAAVRTADFTAPTVTISASVPPPLGNSSFTTRFEWSETVTGFNCTTNVTYQNVSSRTGCTQSGSTFSTTVTPTQNFEGLLRVEMVASNVSTGIFDSAGNPAPAATPLSMVLDSKAPSILRVERVTPNGTYGVGREILFRVVFNEPIFLSGFDANYPRVKLNSSTSAFATVASTTSDSIVFSYIVRSGDATNDLNYSATNALELGSFTVRDAGNNNTSTTLPGTTSTTSLGGSSAIVISGVPPTAPVIQSIGATGGNQVTDYINSTNTNLSVQVSFTPSQILGGRIDLLYGNTVVNSTNVTAGMTSPQTVSLGTATPSQLQQIISDGPATFSVVITDSVGNSSSTSRTLTADFVRPVLTGSVTPARSLGFQEVATLVATSSEGLLFQGSTGCANSSFTIVGGTVSCVVWPQSQTVGSNTLQLSFSPQVQGAWSVTYPAGLLRDRAGNDSMPFSLTGQADTVKPTVLSVTALSANGVYKAGDRISLIVKFDEVVIVNGPTSLSLEVASGTNRNIAYHSGSGTSELRFDYIVENGDVSADLNTSGVSALIGSVTDRSNNPAILDLTQVPTLASAAAIVVDGSQPTKPGTPSLTGFASGQSQGARLNSLTTNFTVSAQVTSESNIARAELLLNGVVIATDSSASSSDVVSFDLGASSNATIRALVTSVANFTVRMISVGGNVSPLSDPLTITPDYTRSSVVVAASSLTLSAQAPSTTVTITLSEDSSDFEVSDIVAAGGTLSSFTANSSTSYTVTFTSDGSENFSIRVLAGALSDQAGNPNLASNILLGVADTSVPAVSSIRFLTPNGTYKAGNAIRVEAAFSERVNVAGFPTISLFAGDNCALVPANYLSGSGSTRLVFERIIVSGDNCLNVTNSGTITVNGGSIRDAAGNDADLTLSTLPNGVNVNADAPAPPLAPIINTNVTSSTQVVDSTASTMNIVIDLAGARSAAGNIKLFLGSTLFATSSFAVNASSVTFNLAASTQLELQTLLEPLIPSSASVAVRAEISDDDGNFTTSPTTTLTAYWLTTYAEKAAAQQLISSFTESPAPTSFSYLAAGVEGVEQPIVNTLNEVLSGMPEADRDQFPEELNAVVAVINSIKAIADDTNGSYTPLTTADLAPICPNSKLTTLCSLSGAALVLFNSLVAEGEFADVDSTTDIEGLAEFSQKLIAGTPLPSAEEFVNSGFANVTSANLGLIWEVLQSNPAGDSGLDSYQEIAALIADALARKTALEELSGYDSASTSAPTLSTYQTAGIEGVTSSNITLVNKLLAEVPANLSDSIAELNGIVETATRLQDLADGAADGESHLTFQDLSNLGISELPQSPEALALFNSALDGRNLVDVDTVPELREIAEVLAEVLRLAALEPTNLTAPATTLTEHDLAKIGITFSAPVTLSEVLFGIADLPNDTSSLETIQDLEAGITAGLEKLAAAGALSAILDHDSSSPTAPSVQDYSDAGILGVTSNNIDLVNEILESDQTSPSSTSELQSLVDSVNKLLAATDGVDNDSAQLTAQDFANLGVNPAGSAGIDSAFEVAIANSLLDEMTSPEVDTIEELAAFALAVEKLAATANATDLNNAPTGSDRITIADLEVLGVTGITDTNLGTFIAALISDPGATDQVNSAAISLSKLQDLANSAALQHIYDSAAQVIAAYDGQNTVPTKVDYQNAGVTGVTDANLELVNGFVAPLPASETDTRAELQGIVDLLDRLAAAANDTQDGNANFNQAELETLGISSISPNAVALINAGIDVAELTEVDSVAELQELADFVMSLLNSAATSTTISPEPTVSDFVRLGLSGVDADNIDALLELIAQSASDGSEIDSLVKLNALVTEADNLASKLGAIDKIGSHTASDSPLVVSDYLTAGVTSFSPSLVGLISTLVSELPQSSRDSLAEIQAISDAANKLRDLADGSRNNGSGLTADEYLSLGFSISDTAQVSLLNSIFDGMNILEFETKADIEEIREVAQTIIDKAAGGAELEVADFHLIGLPAVTQETLPYLNSRIDASADDGSSVDTFAKLETMVTLAAGDERQAAAIGAITNYGDNGNPAPILSNYIDSQITGVSSANLALINSWFEDIPASQSDTVAKIQGIVDAIVAIELGADTLTNNSSQVTNAHLAALGLPTLSTAALTALNNVIDRSSFSSVDTYAELSALISAVQSVSDFANELSTASPSLSDFDALGITGVTSSNSSFVAQALAEAGGAKNSIGQLQLIVDQAVAEYNKLAALQKISEYDGSGSAPTRDDYLTAEVSAVTDGNLAMVNSFIAQRSQAETDTAPEIQAVVDAVNKIRAGVASSLLSPNSLSESDLEALDIAGGDNQEFRALFNDVLSRKSLSDIDTYSELDRIAEIVQALLDTAAGETPTPSLTHTDLALVGVTGVTSTNLAAVLARIEQSSDNGSGINQLSKIQAIANAALNSAQAAASQLVIQQYDDTNTAPTLNDYTNIGVFGVTSDNLSRVNLVIASALEVETDTFAEVQAIVDALTKVESLVDGTAGTGVPLTQEDLRRLGAPEAAGITPPELSLINSAADRLFLSQFDTPAEVGDVVSAAVKIMVKAGGGEPANPLTSADFSSLGFNSVNDAALLMIQIRIQEAGPSGVDTFLELKAIVDAVLSEIAAASSLPFIVGFVAGVESSSPIEIDYSLANVEVANEPALRAVNQLILLRAPSEIDSRAELQSVVGQIAASMTRITDFAEGNGSAPSLSDFRNLGITNVSSANLASLLALIRASGIEEVDTLEGIQALVAQIQIAPQAPGAPAPSDSTTGIATTPPSSTASADNSIEDIVLAETPTSLIVGIDAGSKVVKIRVELRDSAGRLKVQTIVASDAASAIFDLIRGRLYEVSVFPILEDGSEGEPLRRSFSSKPRAVNQLDAQRQSNGRIGISWAPPRDFTAQYRILIESRGRLISEITTSANATQFKPFPHPVKVTVVAIGEGGSESVASSFVVSSRTTLGAVTSRFATKNNRTLISFQATSLGNPVYRVFVNGNLVCTTRLNSCTTRLRITAQDQIRVLSSDGAISPTTNLREGIKFLGELKFIPSTARPAAGFTNTMRQLAEAVRQSGAETLVVTGHANQVGASQTQSSLRLAAQRAAYTKTRLEKMLPGVKIVIVNRGVDSPNALRSNTVNIRAEVYLVTD